MSNLVLLDLSDGTCFYKQRLRFISVPLRLSRGVDEADETIGDVFVFSFVVLPVLFLRFLREFIGRRRAFGGTGRGGRVYS